VGFPAERSELDCITIFALHPQAAGPGGGFLLGVTPVIHSHPFFPAPYNIEHPFFGFFWVLGTLPLGNRSEMAWKSYDRCIPFFRSARRTFESPIFFFSA